MAKVTSKLQVTIPKALAEKCNIEPGDDIDWSATGNAIRLAKKTDDDASANEARVDLFDAATKRQREREASSSSRPKVGGERDWTRDELYDRAESR